MKKQHAWLCTAVFCAFLLGVTLFLFLLPKQDYSQREKRYLAAAPVVSWSGLLDGSVQTQLEDWMADQFPGRDGWVGLNAYWNLATGRNAQQDFYHAKDGYLIAAPAGQDLTNYKKTLQRFDSFAASCGVPASMVLVPSTGWLKEDLLPMGHEPYPDDAMFDLAGELENLTVYDFRQDLLQADIQEPVAYRTDHHLTSWGNYTLYASWREARGLSYLEPGDYAVETSDGFCGTAWSGSGYWLTEPDDLELWDSGVRVDVTITDGGEAPVSGDSLFFRSHLEELDQYPVFLDGNHCQVEIFSPDAPEGSILLIKDSYAHCFATFLAEHYRKVYMLDLRYYRGSISDFIARNAVDEVLFLYGTSTLLTDTNSAWLF